MTVYSFSIDDQPYSVEIGLIQGNTATVTVNQVPYRVRIDGSSLVSSPAASSAPAPKPAPRAEAPKPAAPKPAAPKPSPAPPKQAAPVPGGGERITAPIPGKIMSVMAKVGDSVSAGQVLLVIEAMKMENNIVSPIDGTVKEIAVSNNADVSTGDLLAVVG
ncbi:MAG: biotin/lipoyl-binding protein [Desulfobacula sp.]|nr:biotin/lipoyl-binding protein [Desulfobacula sp.]